MLFYPFGNICILFVHFLWSKKMKNGFMKMVLPDGSTDD